jgi:hypothetical protein
MRYIKQFFSFWYHFIVGDDWRIALGVVVGLGLVALLSYKTHHRVWWLLPILVVTMLTLSLWTATRGAKS